MTTEGGLATTEGRFQAMWGACWPGSYVALGEHLCCEGPGQAQSDQSPSQRGGHFRGQTPCSPSSLSTSVIVSMCPLE